MAFFNSFRNFCVLHISSKAFPFVRTFLEHFFSNSTQISDVSENSLSYGGYKILFNESQVLSSTQRYFAHLQKKAIEVRRSGDRSMNRIKREDEECANLLTQSRAPASGTTVYGGVCRLRLLLAVKFN